MKVELISVGDKKINVIKVIRTITSLGLKEAKELADNAPSIIYEGIISEDKLDDIKKQLEEAGATVSIRGEAIPSMKGISRIRIKELLIEQGKKMPVSDIAAFLKYKNIDAVKLTCESMYYDGDISFAGKGRYFVLTEGADQKKKTKPAKAEKSEEIDVEKELEKYKSMLDKGLIDKEDYEAKKDELLGL